MSLERGRISRVESVHDGLAILSEKGLSEEIGEMCEAWSSGDDSINGVLERFGWETEYSFAIGRNRPRFDGFKSRVGLEHETREQMNVRSHLLWTEAGFQSGVVEAAVFVIPSGNFGSVARTYRELNDEIFRDHFPIECPLLLVEYNPE